MPCSNISVQTPHVLTLGAPTSPLGGPRSPMEDFQDRADPLQTFKCCPDGDPEGEAASCHDTQTEGDCCPKPGGGKDDPTGLGRGLPPGALPQARPREGVKEGPGG